MASIGYPTVAPILPDLLEWLQDGNWPVAHVIGPFLASIGTPLTEEVRRVLQTQDHLWKYWILVCVVSQSPELAIALYPDLVKLAEGDPVDEDEKNVKEAAQEIFSSLQDKK